jgi:hypothetical protein
MVAETTIEEHVIAQIHNAMARGEVPTRHNAIRNITGELDVLPSAVAKVMTRMIEAGTLKYAKNNDELTLLAPK